METARTVLHACLPTRNERFLWLVVSAITLAIVAVNALSILTEAARRGEAMAPYVPWITEATSAVFIILLFPPVGWFVRRLPLDADGMKRAVLAHLGLSMAFSAIHITGMVGLRKLVFTTLYGHSYVFFDVIWRDALYEYRKDVVTYAMFTALLYLVQALTRREEALTRAARTAPRRETRLAFRSGSEQVWVTPRTFTHAKAAGNYVELYVGGGMHLIRQSLAGLEEALTGAGVDVVRIHRSHLVNREQIVSVKPKSDGDAEATLTNGTRLPVSRRYRQALSPQDE
jgi:hypothetical protein